MLAVALLAAFTLAASEQAKPDYTLQFSVTPEKGRTVLIEAEVRDANGTVVKHPRVSTPVGVNASVRYDDLTVEFTWTPDNAVVGTLHTLKTDKVLSMMTVRPRQAGAPAKGDISINLNNADIHDVMKVFGQLTGLKIDVAPGIEASVTIHVTDTPWEQALRKIVTDAGLHMQREGDAIHITR
jgi:hypothetical protein